MRETLKISAAIIGVIIGAGFASGQEIFQFFTSFGWIGVVGGVVATIAFAFIFMQIAKLGSTFQTTSHKEVIYKICGRYLGFVVDMIITFFLFGILVVMIAGSGSLFEQQFGVPGYIGSIIMITLAVISVCLNLEKIVSLLAIFTPILFVAVIFIGAYSLLTMDITNAEITQAMDSSLSAAPHWLLGSALYVSYVVAAGFAMLTVIGGSTKNKKAVTRGGLLGGVGLGILLILFHISMINKFTEIQYVDMPTLVLFSSIAPWLGFVMAFLILGMIYNTAVGMLYSFTARFTEPESSKFRTHNIIIGIAAFGLSFVGFTNLVGTLYPITGYLGFILIGAIVVSAFKFKESKAKGTEKMKTMIPS